MHEANTDNPSVKIYVNKIEKRITVKIKNEYGLELLTPQTQILTKDKNGENVWHLEITEAVLVHCNIVNNDYQQGSTVLYRFVANTPFGSLLEISSANHIFLKVFNSELQTIEVWFTDQNSHPIRNIRQNKLTLVIK